MVHAVTIPLSIVFAIVPATVHRAMKLPVPVRNHVYWGAIGGVSLFLALTWASGTLGDDAAIGLGVLANVACIARVAAGGNRYRQLERIASAIDVPTIDAQVLQWWRAQDGKQPDEAVAWTFRFCEAAITGGRAEDALRWLDAIPPLDLPPSYRGLDAYYRCVAHLRCGDAQAARRAIADSVPSSHEPIRRARASIEALLDAIENDPDALARSRKGLAGDDEPRTRRVWRMAEAHALAANTDTLDGAREALQSLRHTDGDVALVSVAAQKGPASALAAKLLAADSPYR